MQAHMLPTILVQEWGAAGQYQCIFWHSPPCFRWKWYRGVFLRLAVALYSANASAIRVTNREAAAFASDRGLAVRRLLAARPSRAAALAGLIARLSPGVVHEDQKLKSANLSLLRPEIVARGDGPCEYHAWYVSWRFLHAVSWYGTTSQGTKTAKRS